MTDCQRERRDPFAQGVGYVHLIAEYMAAENAGNLVLNRGISGNRVLDLVERWDDDCLDLEPDLLSILIGINDVWRHFDGGLLIDHESIRGHYRSLLDRVSALSPRLILMEPFLIPSSPEKAVFRPFLEPVIQIVRDLAIDYDAALVPLDGLFAAACSWRPAGFWAEDGVHPTEAGHRLIADAWLHAWLHAYQSISNPEAYLTHFHKLTPT